ncbi:MAG: hypothetical protein RL226_1565 [Bacteroidota bacterium]
MKLVADSGSTKTAWRLIHTDGRIEQAASIGLNPFHLADEMITATLESIFPAWHEHISELFFYGAGVGSTIQHDRLERLLASSFPNASVEVNHDLLGAARAACGREAGFAVILGTGTNSCFFDGQTITEHIPSVGYILGDYGSGADLGKRWAEACLTHAAEPDLIKLFYEQYNLNADRLLDQVYTGTRVQTFLASFAPFLAEQKSHPFIAALISSAFDDFFTRTLKRYSSKGTVHVCGSIGEIFRPFLENVAANHGFTLGRTVPHPIAALTLYHT